MASYAFPRITIDHARYWRGAAHRWSTTYFLSGSTPSGGDFATLAGQLVAMESEILYTAPTDSGGFLEARGYGTGGGAPAYVDSYGELTTPSTWVAYSGSAWAAESEPQYENAAEVAMLLRIPLAGLSSTGKPVFGRKFYHSVPVSNSPGTADPDILSTTITALQAELALLNNGSLTGGRRVISNNGRLPSSNPVVEPFFGNHQMPRGRKRGGSSSSSLSSLLAEANKLKSALGAVAGLAEDA